jgi:type IV pilus assembly protein PilB
METDLIDIPIEVLNTITSDQAWHYQIIPRFTDSKSMELYCPEELNSAGRVEELEIVFGKAIVLHPASENSIKKTLSRYYAGRSDQNSTCIKEELSNDFLQDLIGQANRLKSSDIHIEMSEQIGRIRFRVDGRLSERYLIKKEDYPGLINKIKILANLDIAEKRLPQDGRLLFRTSVHKHDIRVSVIPTMFGEKVVMRLLRKSGVSIELSGLGFRGNQYSDYLEGVGKTNGIILISGPTGSGKTTTLYATLNYLNRKDINILTIEDPIEYTIDGINQVQLRDNIGLTYSRALRTFLRQDPDIIMLGEIRDTETAEMAIRAALTGHLVLSTIHTNSAWGIVTRLIDMGIPPFLLAGTLNSAVAQRLVRKICPLCRKEESYNADIPSGHNNTDIQPVVQFLPMGCEACQYTGYSGRVALFEVINIDSELRRMIRESEPEIEGYIKSKSLINLRQSAFELFAEGITSRDEIYPIMISSL